MERTIAFRDAPQLVLRRDGFVLRRRKEGEKAEFTLECRSEDSEFAAGSDLRALENFEADGSHRQASPGGRSLALFTIPAGRSKGSPMANPWAPPP